MSALYQDVGRNVPLVGDFSLSLALSAAGCGPIHGKRADAGMSLLDKSLTVFLDSFTAW